MFEIKKIELFNPEFGLRITGNVIQKTICSDEHDAYDNITIVPDDPNLVKKYISKIIEKSMDMFEILDEKLFMRFKKEKSDTKYLLKKKHFVRTNEDTFILLFS